MKKRKKIKYDRNRSFLMGAIIVVFVFIIINFISPLGFFSQYQIPKDEVWIPSCNEDVKKVAYDFVSEIADGFYRCEQENFCELLVNEEVLPGNNKAEINCGDSFKRNLFLGCKEFNKKICGK